MDTKVTTVIVNGTSQGLTMKVGHRCCFARLTSVKQGAEYRIHIDVNWTYQEFLLQDKHDATHQLFLSSDDCCDFERITVVESSSGKLDMQTQLRNRVGSAPCSATAETLDLAPNSAAPAQEPNFYSTVMSSWKAWLSKVW